MSFAVGSASYPTSTVWLSRATAVVHLSLYFSYLAYFVRFRRIWNVSDRYDEDEEEDSDRAFVQTKASDTIGALYSLMALPAAAYFSGVRMLDALSEVAVPSQTFAGLILIPLVGEIAQIHRICLLSYQGNEAIANMRAAGSCIQASFFTGPLLVLLGWIIGQPLTLRFDTFRYVTFLVSVYVGSEVTALASGKSNYLVGAGLVAV